MSTSPAYTSRASSRSSSPGYSPLVYLGEPFPPVLTKKDYYRRWYEGEFGNRIRAWESHDEMLDSDYRDLVSIRYREAGSLWCRYNVPFEDVVAQLDEWKSDGANSTFFTFNESMVDSHLTVQGEVTRSTRGLELLYSYVRRPMRDALAREARHASGLTVACILRHFCDPSSWDDLVLLLDRYPDHVVEFSCYSYNLGDVPHRNTIIWEVRKY